MTSEEYIREYTKGCSNELVGGGWSDDGEWSPLYQPWLTPDHAREAVRLAKEEVRKEIERENEDAMRYIGEHHSPSEISDFQAAMNIAVAKAFNAGKEAMKEEMLKKEYYDGRAKTKIH